MITTVRSQAPVQISSEGTVALSTNNNDQRTEQVIIYPHSQLKAEIKLIAMAQATRHAATPLLPPLLQKQTEPLAFTARRGTAPGLDALALSEIERAAKNIVIAVAPEREVWLYIEASYSETSLVLLPERPTI